MKIVAFAGSPRAKGNTRNMLDQFARFAKDFGIETEIIDVPKAKPLACTACMGCLKNKNQKCVMTSDPMNEWIEKVTQADGVIVASPTYFANVTPEIKCLIDRFGIVARVNDFMWKHKPAAALVAVRRAGAVPTFDAINRTFQINQMLSVGSSYWNLGQGLKPGDVENDKEASANIKTLAEDFAWLINKLKS